MIDPKKLEEIAKQIHNALPPGIRSMGEEVEKKIRQVLQSQLGKLDLVSLFMLLAKQHSINSVLVEAGPRLCGALLEKGLVDELVLYQAPKLMGDEGRGLFHLPGLTRLFQAPKLAIKDVRMVGPDIRITAKIA